MTYLNFATTNNIEEDVKNYFIEHNRLDTWNHTLDVLKCLKHFEHGEKEYMGCLLHDLGRVVIKDDIVPFCKKFKIPHVEEVSVPGLLHQKISEYIAKEVFKVYDHEILNAIRYHTSSRHNPSLVEQKVFLSDKLSWTEKSYQAMIKKVTFALNTSIDYGMYTYLKDQHDHQEKMQVYLKDSLAAYEFFKNIHDS